MKSLQLRFPLLNFRRKSRDRSLTLCYVLIQNAHHKVLNVNLRSNCGGSKSVPGIGQIYWGYLLVFFCRARASNGLLNWMYLITPQLPVLQMRIWILYIPTYLPGTDCITYMTLDILCLVFVHVSIYKFKYIGECAIGIYWAPLVPRGTVNSNIMSFRSKEGELSHKPYIEHNITWSWTINTLLMRLLCTFPDMSL